ncbi:MAG: hypothetical protein JNL70_10365 [Saprospiraceae bacterium]|nr:hypothetical protein [Saprospiraceae bacterium]
MMKLRIVIGTIVFLSYACNHKEVVCTTPTIVSFSQDIVPIFNKNCNTSGCHSGSSPAGKLNLEASMAYTQLTKKGSGYIDTLTPQYSVLYASMNATTNPMPPNGRLDNCTIELVLKWIEQKAKNN